MTTFKRKALIGFALLLPLSVAAQDAFSPLSRSPLRPQIEFSTSLSEELSLRLGVSQFEQSAPAPVYSLDATTSGSSGMSAAALVDWNFAPGGFRLTGGALYGGWGGEEDFSYGLGAQGDGGYAADPYGLRDGHVTPYLGLGWGMEFVDEGRFGLQLDMGVLLDSAATGDVTGATLFENNSVFGEDFDGLHYTPTFSADLYFRF